MFKLTLTLVILAAFQGALASPIPQDLTGITGTLVGAAGPPTGATASGMGQDIGETELDSLESGFEDVIDRRQGELLSGLLSGIADGSDEAGLLKRQIGSLDVGSLVHDAVVDVPGVVSIVGEVVERPVAGLLNLKRQLSGVLGSVSTGEVTSLLGDASNVGGLLKRQDDDDEDIAERQIPAVGSLVSGLPIVGGVVNGLPLVGGSEGGLPVVGGLLGGDAGGSVLPSLGSGLLKRQVGLSGLGSSTVNGIPVIGADLGDLSAVEDLVQ